MKQGMAGKVVGVAIGGLMVFAAMYFFYKILENFIASDFTYFIHGVVLLALGAGLLWHFTNSEKVSHERKKELSYKGIGNAFGVFLILLGIAEFSISGFFFMGIVTILTGLYIILRLHSK